MKRIISILAVACLLVAMAVPAFASETYTVSGKWRINNTPQLTEFVENVSVSVTSTYGNTYHYTWFMIKKYNTGSELLIANNENGNPIGVSLYDFKGSKWNNEGYQTLDFGSEPQTVSATFYNWLNANAVHLVCDGSTCPATDFEYDGICDDCGMPLTLSLRGYPSIEGIWNKAVYPYGLLYVNNSGTPIVYFFDAPYTTPDGLDVRFNGGNFEVYNLVDGEWVFERTGKGAVEFPSLSSGQIVKLSHDLLYDGTVLMEGDSSFFPTPLWVKVELVTQGEMTNLKQMTDGTMTTLAVCGVGLMALLVVLKLFGKRSLIYRG